jgi:hypothetical protein
MKKKKVKMFWYWLVLKNMKKWKKKYVYSNRITVYFRRLTNKDINCLL